MAPLLTSVRPLPLKRVRLGGGFWASVQERVREHALRHQWEQLEARGYIDNFRILAGRRKGVHRGPPFQDADLYKWLEAAVALSARFPTDRWLEARVEEVADLLDAAQMRDGYLNSWHQLLAPAGRWQATLTNHELFCAGHLLEAAATELEANAPPRLLVTAQRLAEHLLDTFTDRPDVPGHPEIELALVRLFRANGDNSLVELARRFIGRRGVSTKLPSDLLRQSWRALRMLRRAEQVRKAAGEAPRLGAPLGLVWNQWRLWPRMLRSLWSGRYFQLHKPLQLQDTAEGHAVRAMYLYSGAVDVAVETGDEWLLRAMTALWRRTTETRTYVTGAVGSVPLIEGFGEDGELPDRSYAESCAAIGRLNLAWRLLHVTGDASYADEMERTLYNGVLSGLSLDGRAAFYQNPLVSHGEDQRHPWYGVACCPPNLARTLGTVERYLFGESDDGLWVHLYATSEAFFGIDGELASVEVIAERPWEGDIKIRLNLPKRAEFALHLRVPGYATRAMARVGTAPVTATPGQYLRLERVWEPGDTIELAFQTDVRVESAPPQQKGHLGRVVVHAGPLVYCAEGTDNPTMNVHDAWLGGQPMVADEAPGGAPALDAPLQGGGNLRMIPYFAWCNRGPTPMAVWLRGGQG